MIGKVWKVFKEVSIGILLVLSLWLVIGGAYKKDIGNLSDWLSAICNIIMASAAIYAAIIARNWMHPNLQKQGLEKVVLFLQKDLILIANSKPYYFNYSLVEFFFRALKSDIIFLPNEKRLRLEHNLSQIRENLQPPPKTRKINNFKQFESVISEFKWYGYEFKTDKITTIKKIFNIENSIRSLQQDIEERIGEISSKEFCDLYISPNIKNNEKIISTLDRNLDKLSILSKEYDEKYEDLKSLEVYLLSTSPKVTDFFDVK